ncbi:hypothetical protein V1281_000112 [Nitrobacteraceae bacterium AZCC 2161]
MLRMMEKIGFSTRGISRALRMLAGKEDFEVAISFPCGLLS